MSKFVTAALLVMSTANATLFADPPASGPIELKLAANLNKTTACPGEAVRLTALLTTDVEPKTTQITHRAFRMGRYDAATKNVVLRTDPVDFIEVDVDSADAELGGLSGARLSPPTEGLPEFRTVRTPREWGVETEFTPRCLGVYMISAEWTLRSGSKISSQPVVLCVVPPNDAKGNPVVKNEWLKYDTNMDSLERRQRPHYKPNP